MMKLNEIRGNDGGLGLSLKKEVCVNRAVLCVPCVFIQDVASMLRPAVGTLRLNDPPKPPVIDDKFVEVEHCSLS
jgi:hypothetical protein